MPGDIQQVVRECMSLRTLSKTDVLERLYTLDINEERLDVFSSVISSIEQIEEEKCYVN